MIRPKTYALAVAGTLLGYAALCRAMGAAAPFRAHGAALPTAEAATARASALLTEFVPNGAPEGTRVLSVSEGHDGRSEVWRVEAEVGDALPAELVLDPLTGRLTTFSRAGTRRVRKLDAAPVRPGQVVAAARGVLARGGWSVAGDCAFVTWDATSVRTFDAGRGSAVRLRDRAGRRVYMVFRATRDGAGSELASLSVDAD